jgi:Holliday junction DNA helicase RuvA
MIGYLTGKIISKKPTKVLIDVNGVGYSVNISITTFEKLDDLQSTVSLFTFLSVKEDALDLYGFFTQAEKDMFMLLIGVNGVGPKLAQSILSGIQIEELHEALKTGNLSRIIAVPGIGRKTGERLLVELRDKVDSFGEIEYGTESANGVKSDAVAALINLGYNQKNAEKIVRQILNSKPDVTIEELIKEALAGFGK